MKSDFDVLSFYTFLNNKTFLNLLQQRNVAVLDGLIVVCMCVLIFRAALHVHELVFKVNCYLTNTMKNKRAMTALNRSPEFKSLNPKPSAAELFGT